MDVARHDADLAGLRGDDAGAVGAYWVGRKGASRKGENKRQRQRRNSSVAAGQEGWWRGTLTDETGLVLLHERVLHPDHVLHMRNKSGGGSISVKCNVPELYSAGVDGCDAR